MGNPDQKFGPFVCSPQGIGVSFPLYAHLRGLGFCSLCMLTSGDWGFVPFVCSPQGIGVLFPLYAHLRGLGFCSLCMLTSGDWGFGPFVCSPQGIGVLFRQFCTTPHLIWLALPTEWLLRCKLSHFTLMKKWHVYCSYVISCETESLAWTSNMITWRHRRTLALTHSVRWIFSWYFFSQTVDGWFIHQKKKEAMKTVTDLCRGHSRLPCRYKTVFLSSGGLLSQPCYRLN